MLQLLLIVEFPLLNIFFWNDKTKVYKGLFEDFFLIFYQQCATFFVFLKSAIQIKIMKSLFLPILFFCSGMSFSQTTTIQKFEKPTRVVPHSKTVIYSETANYAKEHGSYIADIPKEKSMTFDGEISEEKAKLVDPAKMEIQILKDKNQYFKITNTQKMLVVKSETVLKNEMQQANEKN